MSRAFIRRSIGAVLLLVGLVANLFAGLFTQELIAEAAILAIFALTLATMVAGEAAEARRMSGGKSLGAQRPSVAPSTPAPISPTSGPLRCRVPGPSPRT